MAATEAQKRASKKYVENNYERMNLRVPKGDKVLIQEHAAEQHESVNSFMIRAIRETIDRDRMAREKEIDD